MTFWTKNKIIFQNVIKKYQGHAQSRYGATQKDAYSKMDSSTQGSIAILVALGMTVLLGFSALVTDVGLLYAEKAKLQNAVDAAALAGVQELPVDPSAAAQVAQDYAARNGVDQISYSFEANNSKIIVTAQKNAPTYFAKIWGINSEQLSATARAMILPPTSMAGAVPLSIQQQNFEYGALYTLKSGSSNQPGQYSGWFGALDLSGNGAKAYETDLANGYQGTLSIGQIVDVKHGNMSGPTINGVEARFAQDTRVPRNTFDDHDRNAPEIMYVPIVQVLSSDGNSVQQVKIVGFAAFFLEGIPGNGNESIIQGRFLKTLIPNGKTGGSLTDLLKQEADMSSGTSVEDFGLYTPKLVEQ